MNEIISINRQVTRMSCINHMHQHTRRMLCIYPASISAILHFLLYHVHHLFTNCFASWDVASRQRSIRCSFYEVLLFTYRATCLRDY